MDILTFLRDYVGLSLFYIGITCLLVAGAFVGLSRLLKKLTKGKDITLGKDSVRISDQVKENVSQEMGIWLDLIPLYDDQRDDINRKIFSLENIELLKRQMNMAEERIETVIAFMQQVQKTLLAERLGNPLDAANHPEARIYEVRVLQVKTVLLDIFRRAMRENHLLEKTEIEFDKYVADKLDYMYRAVESTIESFYDSKILLIDDLREAQRNNSGQYKEFLTEVYKEARRISDWGKCEIENLKKAKKILMNNLRQKKVVITSEEAIAQACED
jgi:hypothetical protein